MERNIEGGCRCGAVRYTLAVADLPPAYACHRKDCQTWTGSAFSEQCILPDNAIAVTGQVEVYELKSPSGGVSRQWVCGVCHTRIYNTNSARPSLIIVRAGTLDRSEALNVVAHIWTKRKQSWISIPDGVPSWPEAAPIEAFAAIPAPTERLESE